MKQDNIYVRIPKEDKERIKQEAAKRKWSITTLVMEALDFYTGEDLKNLGDAIEKGCPEAIANRWQNIKSR